MFGTIRKHQTWLWAIIITFTVISFVIYFNPSSRYGDEVSVGDFGNIGGEKITLEKFGAAQREVFLRYLTSYGDWPDKDARDTGFDTERETFYRLLLLRKIKELEIRVSSPVVAQLANDILRSFGGGNPVSLDMLVSRKLSERGLTAADFERFVRNEVAIQQLVSVVGASGRLVTPEEARTAYTRDNEELSAKVVAFLAVNHLQNVTVSTQAVAQFYTNQMPRYRLPERVQVSYVEFGLSNHLAEAEAELAKTNLNELIEADFQRLGTNYVRVGSTPEEAKAKIREARIRNEALLRARKQANEFATVLFDREPLKAGNLKALAEEKGLSARVTEPFDREEGPKVPNAGMNFAQAAFKLSEETPFSAPVAGPDGVYVLAFNRRLPSEVPTLESILTKVTGDCRYEQAVALARQAGRDFLATLTNGLAAGKSFSELATGAKLKPVLLPPFSLSTRSLPEVEQDLSLAQFKQVAFSTPVGQASDLILTRDGGLIVHVQSRLPLDEAKLKENLPRFAAYLRQARQSDAFNDWFRKQADEGLRNTALARQQPPQMQGAPPAP
jgi:parvulin-like peptidyl-prolyl isomerase